MQTPFSFTTAGESHGPGLTAIISNIPAGFKISEEKINCHLARRQKGYGRGARMQIETDRVQVLAGLRNQETTGAPLCLFIQNTDYANWKNKTPDAFTRPRPGHADLVGGIKYRRADLRDILERSSARETAIRTAVGAVALQILECFSINIASFVEVLGGIEVPCDYTQYSLSQIQEITEKSPLRILDPLLENEIKEKIDNAAKKGDTLGGVFCVLAQGVPPALGSYATPESKLDANIAAAFLSLQAIKAIEFGLGKQYAYLPGSQCHDEIFYTQDQGFFRKTNHAGGIEGGMSNGEQIIVKATMKPIPTLMSPLKSVDIVSKNPFDAVKERSDVSAVPAATVVGEGILAVEILRALMMRYGQDEKSMMLSAFTKENKTRFEWL